jgi:hypothetical protein
VAWRYMHWFYGQLDTVFVNSEEYRQSWIKHGLNPARLKILPRGLDTELFILLDVNPRSSRNLARAMEKFVSSMWAGFHGRKTSTFWRLPIAVCATKACRSTFHRGPWPLFRGVCKIFARSVFHRLSEGQ